MTREFLRTLVPSILAQYQQAYGLRDLPVSVEYLRPMIEERGWVDRISWHAYDFKSEHILAQVEFFKASMGAYAGEGDYAQIFFSKHLNFCWKRFAICKEMFHAIIDQPPETRITDVAGLLKLVEMLVSQSSASVQQFSPHTTEDAAIILAVETLFPLEIRTLYEERYRAGDITDLQLATRFRIPQDYARQAMYPTYLDAVKEARVGTLVAF